MIDVFYYEDGVKKAQLIDLHSIKDKQLWIDISDPSVDEMEVLKNVFSLHPVTIEDLANSQTRIKVEEFENYLLCIFYGLQKGSTIELAEIDFILGHNFLITNHTKPLPSVSELKNDLLKLEKIFKRGNEYVMHRILDVEIDNYFPILEEIDDKITDIEQSVLKKATPQVMNDILRVKREVIRLRKIAYQQRDKTAILSKNDYKFISKSAAPYFRDIYDHAILVHDAIESYRESVVNTFEVYMSTVSQNTNEIMKTLSMIATIALPLTVVSGIYGTNFTILPGATDPSGFWEMIGMMGGVCVIMLIMFKKKGWL